MGLWVQAEHPALLPCLLPQVLGLESMLGTATLWPLLLGITVLPALLQMVLLPLCPESPRYLYIIRNLEGPARKSELPCHPAGTCASPRPSACPLRLEPPHLQV